MYKATFYTPDDHAHTSSEEYLEVYRSVPSLTQKGNDRFDTALSDCLHNLNLWATLPQSAEQLNEIVAILKDEKLFPGERGILIPHSIEDWREKAIRRITNVGGDPRLDLSLISRGWIAWPDDLEEVLVGQGQELWIVLRWYSTA